MIHEYKVGYEDTHVPQKKNFCASAATQIILAADGIFIEQERLAYQMGIRINKRDERLYTYPFEALEGDDPRIGFQLANFEDEKVQTFLKQMYHSAEVIKKGSINDLEELLISNIKVQERMIANFHLRAIDKRRTNDGHWVVISAYDDQSKEIIACDPSGRYKSFRPIQIRKLEDGMTDKYDGRERGIVIIHQLKKPMFAQPTKLDTRKARIVEDKSNPAPGEDNLNDSTFNR